MHYQIHQTSYPLLEQTHQARMNPTTTVHNFSCINFQSIITVYSLKYEGRCTQVSVGFICRCLHRARWHRNWQRDYGWVQQWIQCNLCNWRYNTCSFICALTHSNGTIFDSQCCKRPIWQGHWNRIHWNTVKVGEICRNKTELISCNNKNRCRFTTQTVVILPHLGQMHRPVS
jgi:hypothetical protein